MATITPFVKRMRTQGGTFFSFTSALEDIGLNINERNNIVKMSHYALLNLPSLDAPDNLQQNKFNVLGIPGAYESYQARGSILDGTVLIAESFQNYALNLEVNLLAQDNYNPSLQTTVSERVFWKWLKEAGAIRWYPENTSIGRYWREETDTDSSVGYNSIVKCVGTISAGSVRTDTFGTYNETYVLVPTSFGQTPVYFKQVEDDNYHHGLSIVNGHANILGRETYVKPHPDALDMQAYYDLADSPTQVGSYTISYDASGTTGSGWWWTYEGLPTTDDNCYFVDTSSYLTSGIYNIDLTYDTQYDFRRSMVDCMSIEFNLTNLRSIFDDTALTFDDLAIKHFEDDTFDFNAVLVYYSVYNRALDAVLATNLLGILFLDPPSGNSTLYPLSEIVLPSLTKIQSGDSGFGTSYSFRLNIKSDYLLDDTNAEIREDNTASQQVLEDFGQVFDGLSRSLSILNQHTGTINYITQQYIDLTNNQTDILNSISDLQYQVNDIARDIVGTENTIAMFAAGDDPIVDSSVYMYDGKVGVFTTRPTVPFEVNGQAKMSSVTIGDWTFDTSGTSLCLSYNGSVKFVFTSDGSIL